MQKIREKVVLQSGRNGLMWRRKMALLDGMGYMDKKGHRKAPMMS